MRQSYRDKQSRKSRINKEKEENKLKRNFSKKVRHTEKVSEDVKKTNEEKVYDDIVYGRNSVLELLKSNKDINKIFIERGEKHRFYQ